MWVMVLLMVHIADPSRQVFSLEKEFDNEAVCFENMKKSMQVLTMNSFIVVGKCENNKSNLY